MTITPGSSTIGVLGSGTMGIGIAQVCAANGFRVILYDLKAELVDHAVENLGHTLHTLVAKGKMSTGLKDSILANIIRTDNLADVKADLLIEAVVEHLDVKRSIFASLEQYNSAESVFASNTSSISITQIGRDLKHGNRLAGLHFFNPAPLMKLVEVIRGSSTSSSTVDTLTNFCATIGKRSVLANDSPGFIVNRVARLYYVEALKMAEEGVADIESIDKLMRSAGFKMGPFELMDLIGVDTNLSVTKSMYHAFFEEPRFRPSRIQQQKVDAGFFGRKSGKGFYDYSEK
jgi:3-hydroxybutyryl-CoA dehydrogenase